MKLIEKYKNLSDGVKASIWFLLCTFLQKGIYVITIPIFTRIMTPEECGKYSVFTSWQAILTVFVSLNLYSGVYMRGMVKYEDERARFVSSFQGLSFSLAAIWTVIYFICRDFVNAITGLSTVQMLAMIVMIWLVSVFQFWSIEQRVELKYKKLIVVTLVVAVMNPVLGIIFIHLSDDKVTARILGMVLVELVVYFGIFIAHIRRGGCFFNKRFWKYAIAFNLTLVPHYLSINVLNSSDRIMISEMVGDNEAGIYSLAYQISMIMTIFNTALLQTIEPWLYKKIKENQTDDMAKVAYPSFIMIAILNIVLIAFAPEIVAIFAPTEYIDAIWIIPPVAMSCYFMFAYTFFAVYEFYFSKVKMISIATMVGAFVNVVLNVIFIKKFGYMAAGYTTLFCYILYAVCHYVCMKKICKVDMKSSNSYDIKVLIGITTIFMAIGFIFVFTYANICLRYLMILILIIIGIIKRKKIISGAKKLIGTRK